MGVHGGVTACWFLLCVNAFLTMKKSIVEGNKQVHPYGVVGALLGVKVV